MAASAQQCLLLARCCFVAVSEPRVLCDLLAWSLSLRGPCKVPAVCPLHPSLQDLLACSHRFRSKRANCPPRSCPGGIAEL